VRRFAALVFALALAAIGMLATVSAPPAEVPQTLALVEIRSWVVAGQGRHMYALITPPPGRDDLATIVEYTGAFARKGYSPPKDRARADRIVKVARGDRVYPFLDIPMDNRLEAVYWLPVETVEELQRDRAFTSRYFILGPNSSSGLRAAFESSGVPLPPHVLASGGALGEFPGVEFPPGAELPPDQWSEFGFRIGPERAPDR
jgi:hypothetical protein